MKKNFLNILSLRAKVGTALLKDFSLVFNCQIAVHIFRMIHVKTAKSNVSTRVERAIKNLYEDLNILISPTEKMTRVVILNIED